jgi:spore coat protein JB
MVYNADHSLRRRMNCADAIRHGTLFRELHKPFAACPHPTGCAEITDHQALAFAAWELRLYLNTHPDDCEALRLFEEYECTLREKSYATTFVPGCKGRNRWNWLDDPWPWENCTHGGRS